jgi:hypothetical protein
MFCLRIGVIHSEGVIRIENAAVIVVKGLFFDFASYGLELLTNFGRFVLATDDFEPTVLIIVENLGLVIVLMVRVYLKSEDEGVVQVSTPPNSQLLA